MTPSHLDLASPRVARESASPAAAPSRAAFQATLAAALQAVPRAAERVRTAERAALCLAQRERLAAVADDLEAAEADLREWLDAQGRCLLDGRRSWVDGLRARLRPSAEGQRPAEGQPGWWVALIGAIAALEDAAARMGALVGGQSREAPAAALGRAVAARLGRHRDTLLAEAERWARAEDGPAA